MPFPEGWPPEVPSGRRSGRFYITGTATAAFADRAWIFGDQVGASSLTPMPIIEPGSDAQVDVGPPPMGGRFVTFGIRITATVADLEFSFDGTNIHGKVPSGSTFLYRNRHEAGISVKGLNSVFVIEAW